MSRTNPANHFVIIGKPNYYDVAFFTCCRQPGSSLSESFGLKNCVDPKTTG